MPVTKTSVVAIHQRIEYKCDECGESMQQKNYVLAATYPVRYPYYCPNPDCSFEIVLNTIYPRIETEYRDICGSPSAR